MTDPGYVFWLTGLPCSGKTVIANAAAVLLRHRHQPDVVLYDGDVLRSGPFAAGVGFSPEDRMAHNERVAVLAAEVAKTGTTVIVALVSPSAAARACARAIIGPAFVEVYVQASLATCARRDSKGMYAKARAGEIKNFTGVSAPYAAPLAPELVLDSESDTVMECAMAIVDYINRPQQLFIGRYSPFHNAHKALVDSVLDEGKPVLIAVRERNISPEDPWLARTRAEMIRAAYSNDPRVQIIVIPDIAAIHIGRAVGYGIVEHEAVGDISATVLRDAILTMDFEDVAPHVHPGTLAVLKESMR